MTKIDLVTGFLGSGKTTFIREYAKFLLNRGLRVCILENDFGAINVDTMLVSDLICDNLDVEMVAGGCDADCHRRRFKTKLIAMGMKKYDRVIVEPSGLYDVDEFFDTLYDEPLDSWYEIGSVITLVDAGAELPFTGAVYKCFSQEIANSGIALLSKTQCFSKNRTDRVTDYIYEVFGNNNIKIISKPLHEYCDDDFETIMNSGYRRNDYLKFNVEESGFSSLYYMDLDYSVLEWKQKIEKLFKQSNVGNIFRIKGFCKSNLGFIEINATSKEMNIAERSDGQNVFIVIGEGLNEQEINRIIY